MEKSTRSRSWFLVINKKCYNDKINYETLEKYVKDNLNADYFCFCEEKGHGNDESEGNEHIHLYLELVNPVSFSSIQKKFKGAHIELRRGNPTEARNYIYKIGSPENEAKADTNIKPALEFGNWDNYKDIIARGAYAAPKLTPNEKLEQYLMLYDSLDDVEANDLWFAKQYKEQLQKGFDKKKLDNFISRCGKIEQNPFGFDVITIHRKVYYLFGESRTGKSYGVRYKYGSNNVYSAKMSNKHPFDAYNGQNVLLLDEFRSSLSLQDMLSLLDCYPSEVDARYFDHILLADTIILATNTPFSKQYPELRKQIISRPELEEDYKAFCNRFVNGIWELIFDDLSNRSFIFCHSTLQDFSARARDYCNFEEPPIYCDNDKNMHITDLDDFNAIKSLIKHKIIVNGNNIQKQKVLLSNEKPF